jgi:glycosyltransferase involved in cell wall biosynthesis
MRILLIGPDHPGGSIPPYLDVFAAALRRHGVRVDRLGSAGPPYDRATGRFWPPGRIVEAAQTLLRSVDLHAYDLLSVHFGNLEIEQLLPSLLPRRHPPIVYHVHSLDWTLFTKHVPAPHLRTAVEDGIRSMDGLVHFGRYARTQLEQRLGTHSRSVVSWLPTTIPPGTRSRPHPTAWVHRPRTDPAPVGSLCGYAAPWKDIAGLATACAATTIPCRVVIAGPLWDDPDEAGIDLGPYINSSVELGAVAVSVVPDYLGPAARKALTRDSDFGIFPYQPHPTFQGSGAIADYLANHVPVLATDVANMAELVEDAGIIVPPGNPDAFGAALDTFAADADRRRAARVAAADRSHRFHPNYHAGECLRLYDAVCARQA